MGLSCLPIPLPDGWQLGGRWDLHPEVECLESPNIFSEEVSLHVSFLNSRAKRHFTQFEIFWVIVRCLRDLRHHRCLLPEATFSIRTAFTAFLTSAAPSCVWLVFPLAGVLKPQRASEPPC